MKNCFGRKKHVNDVKHRSCDGQNLGMGQLNPSLNRRAFFLSEHWTFSRLSYNGDAGCIVLLPSLLLRWRIQNERWKIDSLNHARSALVEAHTIYYLVWHRWWFFRGKAPPNRINLGIFTSLSVSHMASPEFSHGKTSRSSRQVKISSYVLDRYQKLKNPRHPPVGFWSIRVKVSTFGHLKMGMGKTASIVAIGRKLFMMSSLQ